MFSEINIGAVLGVVLAVIVLIPLVRIERRKQKRRYEELRRIATSMGFTFENRPKVFSIPNAKRFHLFRRGGFIQEVMLGRLYGCDVAIFRYLVIVHYAHNPGLTHWRVAAFHAAGTTLPAFRMRPHNWVTRFFNRGIHLEMHPAVSQRFFITGADVDRIRRLFNSQVLSALAAMPETKVTVEGDADWLLVYRRAKLAIKPETVPGFAVEAENMARIFIERKSP